MFNWLVPVQADAQLVLRDMDGQQLMRRAASKGLSDGTRVKQHPSIYRTLTCLFGMEGSHLTFAH